MEYFKGILTTVFVLHIIKVNANAQLAPDHNGTMYEDQELRTLLKNVLDQNRKLVLQNKRLQQVWTGMKQMCKALSMPTCDCSDTGSNVPGDDQNNDSAVTDTHNQPYRPLRVMSIQSSGEHFDVTTVSIEYSATPKHTTGWYGPRINGGLWITSGQKTQATPGSSLYTSTIDIEQLQSIRALFFRLYNDDEIVSVNLNLIAIEKPQHQNVTESTTGLLQINNSYMAPLDSDLNITAIVKRDPRDFGFVDAFLTSLDTSANPPKLLEIMNHNDDGIDVSISRRTDNTSNMVISLRYPYAQYGGILGVLVSYREPMPEVVKRFSRGQFIKVYAPDSNEVVPQNSLGISPAAKQTFIYPPAHTITCAAIGNPRPNVAFVKIGNDGKEFELETEMLPLDNYVSTKLLTLSTKQPREIEGRYICSATSGNQTVYVSTEVVVLQPAVFDEHKTGVIKNTSKCIVISCKARGKPKPELAIRLYEEYGPDLIKSGMYKVKQLAGTKTSSRVTLSISPTDAIDIHTVYCVANQGGPDNSFETSRRVNVYPEVEKENNLEFYRRIQDSLFNRTSLGEK